MSSNEKSNTFAPVDPKLVFRHPTFGQGNDNEELSFDASARRAFQITPEGPDEQNLRVTILASARLFQAKDLTDAKHASCVILKASELKSEIRERKHARWIGTRARKQTALSRPWPMHLQLGLAVNQPGAFAGLLRARD